MKVRPNAFYLAGVSMLCVLLTSATIAWSQGQPRYFIDSAARYSSASGIPRDHQFQEGLKLSASDTTWLRITVPSFLPNGEYCICAELDVPVNLYYLDRGRKQLVRNGAQISPRLRSVAQDHRYLCFPVTDSARIVYLKVPPTQNEGKTLTQLESKSQVMMTVHWTVNASFLMLGALSVMVLGSLSLFLFVRDKSFLLFALFLIAFYTMINSGFLTYLLGDIFPRLMLDPVIHQLYFIICPIAFLVFARHFFSIGSSGNFARTFTICLLISIICLATLTMKDLSLNSTLILFYNLLSVIVVAVSAIRAYRKDHFKPALYVIAGIAAPVLVALVIVLDYFSVITVSGLPLLANLSMIVFTGMLSAGVIIRYRALTREMVDVKYRNFQKERETALFKEQNDELIARNRVIEEQKLAIEVQTEKLEELNEGKDKLLAVLVHDLRGPMLNLQAIVTMLNNRLLTSEEFHELFDKLKHDIEDSSRMIDSVLHWVQSQRNAFIPVPSEFSVHEVVIQVADLFRSDLTRKQIALQVTGDTGTKAFADSNHVTIIIRNLIANAIKFSREGSTIQVDMTVTEHRVSISVIDQGVGMNASEVEKIMQQGRINSTRGTHGEKGTGLGLLLCLELIENNSGKFYLESSVNEGTKIVISFPLLPFLNIARE